MSAIDLRADAHWDEGVLLWCELVLCYLPNHFRIVSRLTPRCCARSTSVMPSACAATAASAAELIAVARRARALVRSRAAFLSSCMFRTMHLKCLAVNIRNE